MIIEIYGKSVEINIDENIKTNNSTEAARLILRDSSPDKLRSKRIKRDFGPIDITRGAL